MVKVRVRLSTIVRASRNSRVLAGLCYRVYWKLKESRDNVLEPVIIVDSVPTLEEQKVAATLTLDFLAYPWIRTFIPICEPKFEFKKGISRNQLKEFFKEYSEYLKECKTEENILFPKIIECKGVRIVKPKRPRGSLRKKKQGETL